MVQKDLRCYNCGETGHLKMDCKKPIRQWGSCYTCGDTTHRARNCPQNVLIRKPTQSSTHLLQPNSPDNPFMVPVEFSTTDIHAAKPLYDMLKKNVKFRFGPQENNAFESLKKLLASQPVLAIYSPHLPTELHCDASTTGFGAVLMQKQSDGKLKPVFYFRYVLDVIVYTGSTSEMQAFSAKLSKAGNIVATLMQPYLEKGHQLFVDNWYSSPALDAIISTISCTRKTLKWYKKFFFHLLDISIWNAYCLYKFNTKKNISMSNYHLALITELLKKYSESREYNSGNPSAYLMRFKERHFPALYSSDKTKRQNPMRRCIVCSMDNKRRSTRYYCKKCNVGLCVVPCFEMYYTEQ
ncbi:uncharacterized protein LOC122403958 [Colletes gigas]|uniref:uncharacterized protein LOC122403958 n=1 Tax=Colletes gigas TaxID=935657 RepID=UPI001C9B7BCB|nr:uncharacterized protein LOC122403958 [Colletes gigas]